MKLSSRKSTPQAAAVTKLTRAEIHQMILITSAFHTYDEAHQRTSGVLSILFQLGHIEGDYSNELVSPYQLEIEVQRVGESTRDKYVL